MIKILIVHDLKVIREKLKYYLAHELDVLVVAIANNSIDALEKIKTLKPNVVFMGAEMPGGVSGLEMTSAVANLYPEIKVIILTGNYTEEYGQMDVRAGAAAYLPTTTAAEQLIEVVRKVHQQDNLDFLRFDSLYTCESNVTSALANSKESLYLYQAPQPRNKPEFFDKKCLDEVMKTGYLEIIKKLVPPFSIAHSMYKKYCDCKNTNKNNHELTMMEENRKNDRIKIELDLNNHNQMPLEYIEVKIKRGKNNN